MSRLADRSDEALLEAWRAGQLAAFDALYARHVRPLFGFIVRALAGDRAEAEDVLHHTFLAVLQEARTRPVARVRALLFEVARNACANRRRALRRADDAPPPALVAAAEADEVLIRRQDGQALQAALTRLPPGLLEVWSLRAAGLSYDEVARSLRVPLGTVKSRLHEVLQRLREELNP